MNYIARKALITLTFLIQFGACSSQEKGQSMSEPLMGMSYNPDSVRFDLCPNWFDSREGRVPGKEWIFSRCTKPEGTYYIYSGLMKQWNDQKEVWVDSLLEPDFGVVIKVSGKKITEIGTPDILYGRKQKLPEKVMQCLAEDAVKRYIKAYGSTSDFQKSISSQKVAAENLPRVLVEALRSAGLSIPDKKVP
ncbi:MAG: hypothetical protein ABIW76_06215 [Fibrobacteria bacterium]